MGLLPVPCLPCCIPTWQELKDEQLIWEVWGSQAAWLLTGHSQSIPCSVCALPTSRGFKSSSPHSQSISSPSPSPGAAAAFFQHVVKPNKIIIIAAIISKQIKYLPRSQSRCKTGGAINHLSA